MISKEAKSSNVQVSILACCKKNIIVLMIIIKTKHVVFLAYLDFFISLHFFLIICLTENLQKRKIRSSFH